MICIKTDEQDGKHGITLKLYNNLYLRDTSFIPHPKEATATGYGFTLDKALEETINFGESVQVFSLSLSKKNGEHGWSGWGERKFFIQIDRKKIEMDF